QHPAEAGKDAPVRGLRHRAGRGKGEEGADRHEPMPRPEERVRDAPAVELPDREQIEGGDEQADPAGERHGVHDDVHALRDVAEDEIVHEGHQGESPNVTPPPSATTARWDQRRPIHRAGTATIKPASGPATAMSKSELRSRAGERMRITAPSVPNRNRGGGAGMKYGRVTAAP